MPDAIPALPDVTVPTDRADSDAGDYRTAVHPEDVDSLDALLAVAEDDRAHAILRVRQGPDGWRLVDHQPVGTTADGAVRLARRDVTGREHALERAGKTEAYWRTIMRHGHESIAVLDPDHLTIRHASDHLADLLGSSAEHLVGSAAAWHVDRRDLRRVRELVEAFAAGTDLLQRVELRLRRPGRAPVWTEAVVSDARDDAHVGAFVVNLREIGDRKRAEEQLRSSEHLFRVLVQHVADGAIVIDRTQRISFVSPLAAAVLGSPESELVGHPLPLSLGPDGLSMGGRPAAATVVPVHVLPTEARNAEGRWFDVVVHDLTDDPVVAGWVLILRDVTDRRDRVEALRRQVESDPLTGLASRRGFEQRVADALERGHSVGIGFLDLDGFKSVNDRLGHAAGDALLVQVGDRLRSAVRPSDEVGRFGGDEFVVALMDVADHEALVAMTGRITREVSGRYRIDGEDVAIGASAGWTLATPGTTVSEALERADRRMYLQKQETR